MNEPSPSMDSLVTRLARLEKQNRRMKRMSCFVLGGLAVILLMGQSQCNTSMLGTKVVEAQKLIIHDANGKPRVEISETGFTLKDDKGTQISLFSDGNTVELFLLGKGGRVELRAGPTPHLYTADNEFKNSAYVYPTGVNLKYNKVQRAELAVDNDSSYLRFYNHNTNVLPRLDLTARNDGARLTLADKNLRSRAVLGSVSLAAPRTGAKTITSEESLTLFDKDGKVSWETPK